MTSQEITRQNQNLKDLIFTLKEKEHWERSRRLTEQSILAFSDQSWMKEITQVILVGHGTSLASTMTAEERCRQYWSSGRKGFRTRPRGKLSADFRSG